MDRTQEVDLFSRPASEPLSTGILPSQTLLSFVDSGKIISPARVLPDQIQPASIDLRLGKKAYQVRASFLPGHNCAVDAKIRDLLIRTVDLTEPAVFAPNSVFIIPLIEGLDLPKDVSGKANPKSTTGRLDIFTRLITDRGHEFELVPKGYSGALYLEVVSRTFPIVLKSGMKLNQLRLVRGNPPSTDSMLAKLAEQEKLVYEDDEGPIAPQIQRGLSVSVDLQGNGSKLIAYKARKNSLPVDLSRVKHYGIEDYWERVYAPRSGGLILEPHEFYIMASAERIVVPPSHAAEMVAFDPSFGEFRIHYAGFFDPGFGHGVGGTKAVLEVRAHEVPILLEDRQMVGKLVYHKMAQKPEKVYGGAIGSSYQKQGLTLSKQFIPESHSHPDDAAPSASTLVGADLAAG
jgi:dCTP deaminase